MSQDVQEDPKNPKGLPGGSPQNVIKLTILMLQRFHSAGVESPSHAIRADADPLARSATSVVITLADKYTYDCPVEILIYPSGGYRHSTLLHSMALQIPPLLVSEVQ